MHQLSRCPGYPLWAPGILGHHMFLGSQRFPSSRKFPGPQSSPGFQMWGGRATAKPPIVGAPKIVYSALVGGGGEGGRWLAAHKVNRVFYLLKDEKRWLSG
jgi:hypothetical protein